MTSQAERDARIAEIYLSGQSLQQTADAAGVSFDNVRRALKRVGVAARHGREAFAAYRTVTGHATRLPAFTPEQEAEAVTLYLSGLSQQAVGERIGVTQTCVGAILRRRGVGARAKVISPTDDQKRQMVKAYLAGDSRAQAAAPFGFSQKACENALRAEGISLRGHNRPSPEDETIIISLYRDGCSTEDIPDLIGDYSPSTCINVLERHGIDRRSPSEARQKHTCDHSFFDRIDTEKKAYLLGFISADGNIAKASPTISVSCNSQDRPHLLKFREALASDARIVDRPYTTAKGLHRMKAIIWWTSRRLVAGLAAAGVGPKKSLTLEPWEGPECLMRHYWRGVFDGDGSLCQGKKRREWRISLTGSHYMVEGFRAFLLSHVPSAGPGTLDDCETYRSRAWGCWPVVCLIARLLFDGAAISLDRKREKVVELLAHTPAPQWMKRYAAMGLVE